MNISVLCWPLFSTVHCWKKEVFEQPVSNYLNKQERLQRLLFKADILISLCLIIWNKVQLPLSRFLSNTIFLCYHFKLRRVFERASLRTIKINYFKR
jgi:hypothetical protein